jgi:uncharacterized protein YhfF
MTVQDSVSRMWQAYVTECGVAPGNYVAWYFGDNETDANGLVELVLAGVKRGTASALWAHESDGDPIPQPGDLAIVTNWSGVAKCIIRTTEVSIVPYNEVTEAFAAIEGEGDKSLRYWKELHWPYFAREMNRIGRDLTDTIPIVCHQFELVYR